MEHLCKVEKVFGNETFLFGAIATAQQPVAVVALPDGSRGYVRVLITNIESGAVRTYRLSGLQSEYGLGNISFVQVSDEAEVRAVGDRIDLFLVDSVHRVPETYQGVSLRVSLKIGCTYQVFFAPLEDSD